MDLETPMAGRTVLVTGATGGIGLATADGLAALGARVGIVGRDRQRAGAAAATIRARNAQAPVDVFVADLSVQDEVRGLAGEVLATYSRLDVLVNNAGGFWANRHATRDGLERTFAVNHLAPFLLTNLLLDRLTASAPARIVTVSSGAHTLGRLDFEDLQGERAYSGSKAYNDSKLANVLFSYELARRLAHRKVTANALHPGMTRTGFGAEDQQPLWKLVAPLVRPFMRSPERGAVLPVRLASSAELHGVTGKYFAGDGQRRSSGMSYDRDTAARLWRVSAELVGLPAAHDPLVAG
jgi:retinol dehydrogenase 14